VGDLLPGVLGDLGLAEGLRAHRAVDAWRGVVGERLAACLRAVSIHNGVLLVETESSVWMHEIQFHKARILKRLEEECGEGIVRDLRCVLAPAS